jgi:hypothetical protein
MYATARGAAQQPAVETSSEETPGLVVFAAIMMFMLGGFQVAWAFVEFANAVWIASTSYGTFGGRLWLWGIVDIAVALITFYAGYSLLAGARFGQIFGLIVAGVSALRWFFYLPANPWAGIVIIAIDVLIIYGLVANNDYFRAKGQSLV